MIRDKGRRDGSGSRGRDSLFKAPFKWKCKVSANHVLFAVEFEK